MIDNANQSRTIIAFACTRGEITQAMIATRRWTRDLLALIPNESIIATTGTSTRITDTMLRAVVGTGDLVAEGAPIWRVTDTGQVVAEATIRTDSACDGIADTRRRSLATRFAAIAAITVALGSIAR